MEQDNDERAGILGDKLSALKQVNLLHVPHTQTLSTTKIHFFFFFFYF